MSDNIQQLCDRLRAMYVPPSLQIELQPRLTREDAEAIIGHITQLERELAEAKAKLETAENSARVLLRGADFEVDSLRAQLTAANATIAACREAGNGALAKIASERMRQVSKEGYTTEHDDQHTRGELAAAAADYASPYEIRARSLVSGTFDANVYPTGWVKKVGISRIDELVKAGALIVAEIERLERSTPAAAKEAQ